MNPPTRRAAVMTITLFLAGCADFDESAGRGHPDQPVQSPAGRAASSGAGTRPATPAACSAVSRRLVGRSLGAARSIARDARCQLRVVIEDGERLSVTDDFRPGRINVR